jgi:hypothetical protein
LAIVSEILVKTILFMWQIKLYLFDEFAILPLCVI